MGTENVPGDEAAVRAVTGGTGRYRGAIGEIIQSNLRLKPTEGVTPPSPSPSGRERDVPGDPGLLAAGGALAGGGPFARPDLHFAYNLLEMLFLAAGYAVTRTGLRPQPAPGSAAG